MRSTRLEPLPTRSTGTAASSVIPISSSLQTKVVGTSTLNSTAVPINAMVGSGNLYVIDASVNQIDVLTGSPPGLKQSLQFPSGLINLVGREAPQPRLYAISQQVGTPGTASPCAKPSVVTTTGVASALEASTFSISATLPVGVCPVYGLQSADGLAYIHSESRQRDRDGDRFAEEHARYLHRPDHRKDSRPLRPLPSPPDPFTRKSMTRQAS